MCTREMVGWRRRRLLDSSCGCVLALCTKLSWVLDQFILAAANKQLSVVDNRLAPDLLANSFWQLNDVLLPAPRESFAAPEVDVDLRDIDAIVLQQR